MWSCKYSTPIFKRFSSLPKIQTFLKYVRSLKISRTFCLVHTSDFANLEIPFQLFLALFVPMTRRRPAIKRKLSMSCPPVTEQWLARKIIYNQNEAIPSDSAELRQTPPKKKLLQMQIKISALGVKSNSSSSRLAHPGWGLRYFVIDRYFKQIHQRIIENIASWSAQDLGNSISFWIHTPTHTKTES